MSKLLVLDEAFAGVDARRIYTLLNELKREEVGRVAGFP